MASPIDDVLGFFEHLAGAEAAVHQGLLVDELDMMDEIRLRKKLKPLFDGKPGSFIDLPQRPITPKPEWLAKERGRETGPRTVYACQIASVGDDTLVLIYCDEYVKASTGMWNRFAVGFVGDFLKVVTREVRCSDCGGSGCAVCKRSGWRHVGGRKLRKVVAKETRKLVAPTDPESLAVYDAL